MLVSVSSAFSCCIHVECALLLEFSVHQQEYRQRIDVLEKSKENEQSHRIENLRAREQLLQK